MVQILRDPVLVVSDEPDTETGVFHCMLAGKLADGRMVQICTAEETPLAAVEIDPEVRLEIERLMRDSHGPNLSMDLCNGLAEELRAPPPPKKPRKRKLTKAERSEIGRRAAKARWAKKKDEETN